MARVLVAVYVEPETFRDLRELADAEERSVSTVVRRLIEAKLASVNAEQEVSK